MLATWLKPGLHLFPGVARVTGVTGVAGVAGVAGFYEKRPKEIICERL